MNWKGLLVAPALALLLLLYSLAQRRSLRRIPGARISTVALISGNPNVVVWFAALLFAASSYDLRHVVLQYPVQATVVGIFSVGVLFPVYNLAHAWRARRRALYYAAMAERTASLLEEMAQDSPDSDEYSRSGPPMMSMMVSRSLRMGDADVEVG